MAYKNLNQFVDLLRAIQIKDDNDIFLGVTGRKGSGKSSLAIQIAKRYVEKYFKEPFNVEKYIAYNNDDVIEKIYTLPEFSPLIGDEAVRFAWSRDWNKSENKELARLTTQIRTKKLIFFMNIPKLSWIDRVYRDGMLDIWLWVHATFVNGKKESHALVFEPDQNQGEIDSWHMDILRKFAKKKKNKIGRFTDIHRVYKMVVNHPCFMDTFPFPKVEEQLYQRYLGIRKIKAFEKESQYVNQKDTAKIMAYNLKENWHKFFEAVKEGKLGRPTNKQIADILLNDPTRNKFIASHAVISLWIKEIKAKLPEQKILIPEKPKEPETLEIPETPKTTLSVRDLPQKEISQKENV